MTSNFVVLCLPFETKKHFLYSISLFSVQKSSALSCHSSALSQNPLENKVDNGLKVNQYPVVASGHGSIDKEAGSNKIASLPESVCHIGGNIQYAQQTAKPSGLRMPSPSLGFFTQVC